MAKNVQAMKITGSWEPSKTSTSTMLRGLDLPRKGAE